ncbi:MAG: AAA family ATPase [Mycobacterium sp.]
MTVTDDDQFAPQPGDDVDSRAAELMARLAARQGLHDAAPRERVPSAEPVEPAPQAETPQPETPQAETAQAEAPPPVETPPVEAPPVEAPTSDGTQRTGRRMAAPPWQPTADPPVVEPPAHRDRNLDASPAADARGHGRPVPPRGQPADPRRAFRPDWQSGPPPPPPGWNGPPPPPGWPGPPPRMPPRRDRVAPPPPAPDDELAARRRAQTQTPATRAARPFDDDDSLEPERLTPQFGWRRMLYRATGGRVNPGVSQKDREQQDLLEQIKQPLGSDFRIAVLSIKGGVGKTTTTIGLGSAFAMVRSDRVIAVDANPDRGTLAERISDSSTTSTVRDLLLDPDVSRYADVRQHTRMAPSRLEVLASVQDPAVAEIYGESDYRRTVEILQAHYNIILTDCGTGIMHSSMASVLDLAHALVLVSSPAVDAARSAAATLDWLSEHGYGMLARESHVVLSGAQANSKSPVFEEVFQYFEARSGSIHVIPFEPHLASGADVDFAMLSPDAVRAYLELAGAVAAKFPRVR